MRSFEDERGLLSVLEEDEHILGRFKRVFWIYGVPTGSKRAQHKNTDQQLLIALAGKLKVRWKTADADDIVELAHPSQALFLPADTWRELSDFSPGTVLLVLSGAKYDARNAPQRSQP